jgi:YD repeat-containing protein
VKVETEVDYRHPLGLQFSRHYHSFRFYEPFSRTPGGVHTETRLGTVWRTNFDKRIIVLDPTSTFVKTAISLPSGDVQYFDPAGNEIFNYRGAAGTLVTAANGFFYRGPDSTEFYGTDGRLRTVSLASGQVLTLTYSDGTTGANGGFIRDAAGNPTALTLPANTLIRVADSYGNTLSFGYDIQNRMVVMTDAGGGQYLYSYDVDSNLTSVTFPDTRVRTYRYNEPANMMGGASIKYALTSIVDENNDVFASFKYDTSGRAVSSEHAGGVQHYDLTYNANDTSVNDPLNTLRTFGFATVDGISRYTGASLQGGAGFGTGVKNRTVDTRGNVTSQTDFNDIKTCYAYDTVRNLETVRVEGLAAATTCSSVTPAGAALPAGSRKITTEWHARWRLPLRVSDPQRRTTFSYNGDAGASCAPGTALIDEGAGVSRPIGVLCSKSVQATSDANGAQGFNATLVSSARQWSYTYNATGQILTADGPRTDVSDLTTYTYSQGNLATITNAASHVTSITAYNADGQPTTIIDPNGMTITLGYDARQRLTSRNSGGEVTSYDYDGVGHLTKVTLPDSSYLSYTYDPAHRLTGLSDSLSNRIAYTLDAMGNRTLEQVRDPASALAQTRSRVYNSLNRLFQELGAQNQTTEYGYDNQGNVASVKDPLNHITSNQYDTLNRLKQVTDPNLGVTQYAYNGLDALTQVTDPRSLVTGYTVDGLGNLTQQSSPDTGTTINTYDVAGNLLTQTDAKGQVTTYVYDALNRVTSITFHDGSKQTYAYDQGANGIGRLSSITETNPASQVTSQIAYAYELHGRVSTETRTINGIQYVVAYTYDSAGRLSGMTYPSGRTVTYAFDALGRISGLSTTPPGGSAQFVVSNVAYHPFGGVKSFSLGNGQAYTRSIDLDGRIASYTLGAQSFGVGYDAASRIEFISDLGTPANSNNYGYDSLDRLSSAVTPATPYAYSYDAVGNRSSRSAGSSTDTYAYNSSNNRIASITPVTGPVRSFVFDANGSTTADGNNTYSYDTRGRMVQATSSLGTSTYQVNALGQRIRKTNSLGDKVFHYDTGGRLIAETDPAGALKRELIYLGDIPVAVVQ